MEYPPAPSIGRIKVLEMDLCTLDDREFLNNVIIDFYARFVIVSAFLSMFVHVCHLSVRFSCGTYDMNINSTPNNFLTYSSTR